jgi:hypothetical protein
MDVVKVPVLLVDYSTKEEELVFIATKEIRRSKITIACVTVSNDDPGTLSPGYFVRHWSMRHAELIPLSAASLQRILDHKLRKDLIMRHLTSRGRTHIKKNAKHAPSRLQRATMPARHECGEPDADP